MAESSPAIENLFSEGRTFPPPDGFKADALVTDRSLHEQAEQDLEGFWAEEAERLHWTKPWDQVLEWDLPFAKWFVGGQLNVSDNCLDRHVEAGGGDKVAYHWEGEPGDTRTITYEELRDDVARFANGLKSIGVQRGDRVNIYMGMVPELPVAMLACARLGAAHSVVDGQTTDCPPEAMDAEDLLYLLYTSGTTAKPKGIMHTTGGYLTGVAITHRLVFDLHPDTDVYWCAADIGWVTGHSYIVYGPLANHATSILYEGAPNFPDKDRWWEIIEKYKVTDR